LPRRDFPDPLERTAGGAVRLPRRVRQDLHQAEATFVVMRTRCSLWSRQQQIIQKDIDMPTSQAIGTLVIAAMLASAIEGAAAFDDTKYPDWSGQWLRPPGVGFQWDQTKPLGRGQQAPLTPEYQAVLEASLADQAAGGQGGDLLGTCLTNGMPRMMTVAWPIEFVILPTITYVNFTSFMPRRIYTDGRDFPQEIEPSFIGYSIGHWLDTDGDGRFDTLEVETRDFKGPRTFEPSGLPLHFDSQSVIRERLYLDKSDPNILHNDITTIDHALTRPWTVNKRYRRDRNIIWFEDNCTENNRHVFIDKEDYYVGADGLIMPTRKGQPAPDLRHFASPAVR
jgi:hypothetical protein